MKREMQKDFQNYMHQNQNVDARKQRIQKHRQDIGNSSADYYNNPSTDNHDSRRRQIADEVFNEIMSNKGSNPSVQSRGGYSKQIKTNIL